MSMVDGAGAVVASYNYDPYGNVITATGTMAEVNPLRYRGYYYDTETGFYYLQSRYYDPELGRFLNADALVSTGQGLLGNNMFAYCGNNPINTLDSNGFATERIAQANNYARDSATILSAAIVLGVVAVEILDKEKEESHVITAGIERNSKYQEIFPENPLEFAPQGLLMKVYVDVGKKNGGIIKWEIPGTKIAIFEWNEDFQNGPHYHVMHITWGNQHLDPNHYRPGDPVPEPWNTVFFAYKKG